MEGEETQASPAKKKKRWREGGERERESEGGFEGNGYYSNHALFQSVFLNAPLSLSLFPSARVPIVAPRLVPHSADVCASE